METNSIKFFEVVIVNNFAPWTQFKKNSADPQSIKGCPWWTRIHVKDVEKGTMIYFYDLSGPPKPSPRHGPKVKNLCFRGFFIYFQFRDKMLFFTLLSIEEIATNQAKQNPFVCISEMTDIFTWTKGNCFSMTKLKCECNKERGGEEGRILK